MTQTEQQRAARKFSQDWQGKGYEKGESQKFWLDLLCNVYGVQDFANFVYFENQIKEQFTDKTITNFIDVYIPSTKVMIEQKSQDKDLRSPIKQSDGSLLNPFQQARKYIAGLPLSQHPRWVVTCNFKSFLVYDMENPNGEPEEILLENLEKEYYRLSFLTDAGNIHLKKELEISKKAGDIIGEIYDAILKQYKDADNPSPATLKSLNMLCVRIVFCLYAEDAEIFGHKSMFGDYLKQQEAKNLRRALLDLFQVLDQKEDERDEYLEESLAAFPYVNGGLFTEEDKTIPQLTEEIKELLVLHASSEFDWSEISPTIFGAIFESTLNPETRRSGGMHYTSIENIHKVIDPLFMDELWKEFNELKQIKATNTRISKIKEFHKRLSTLKFLDPACGSGNFLTETYLSLRRLGNECIKAELNIGEGELSLAYNDDDLIQVSIQQFYGIEINDFAAVVAKTALWIAESQMLKETAKILNKDLNFLPLKSYANIVEGNALRIDWETVVPKSELNYILGNPPFVGARLMSEEQKKDVISVWGNIKNIGNVDYVSCWYKKSADMMKDTNIRTALVSTNSITQGEQVAIMWKPLMESGIYINFAYRTFRWDSEANLKAHVHCVIVGFSYQKQSENLLFLNETQVSKCKNINGYLVDAPNIFIESRKKPICKIEPIDFGSMANDGGYLCDYSEDKMNEIINQYPDSKIMFKKFLGATEFLHNKQRYCLWLKDINPSLIKKISPVYEAILKVKEMRLNSDRKATQKLADQPYLFGEIRQPDSEYLLIPRHSSENRRYIPLGYESADVICGDANMLVPNATLYHFGILTSNVHNAWMRAVCGRLKSDYRYSKDIVYNNFPWVLPKDETSLDVSNPCGNIFTCTKEQATKIEQTAQGILDARAKYPESSLADLYDELTMPPELRKAHQANDRAVMAAYGFSVKMTESECVAELFKMYEGLVGSC